LYYVFVDSWINVMVCEFNDISSHEEMAVQRHRLMES
jgi:hypothetical protein